MSRLVNLQTLVFEGVADRLPANFGQPSEQEINAEYEQALVDIPRRLVNDMLRTVESVVGGSAKICAFLHDRYLFLDALTDEVRHLSDIMYDLLGGEDWEEYPFKHIWIYYTQTNKPLDPLAVHFLRALIRIRIALADFQRVARDVEIMLGTIAQIHRDCLDPSTAFFHTDIVELGTQLRSWEAVFQEVYVDWFGVWNTVLFWAQRRRQDYYQSQGR
ncbi:hypothetical protein diail_3227 [Diaporthe ilicicola]|nr:hypothetical protein diail_3227 [Diaporthe ilicicola]